MNLDTLSSGGISDLLESILHRDAASMPGAITSKPDSEYTVP